MAEPPDQRPAAAGRGHLRASHADREQAIGTLKAAFVQGRLAKDEFDLRVGRALAARTCAELAAVTADLPAGLAAAQAAQPAQPARPARAQGQEPMRHPGRMIAVATAMYGGAWVLFLSPAGGNRATFLLVFSGFIPYLLAWFVAVVNMIALWREKRAGRQSSRRPGVGGQASRRTPSAGPAGQLLPGRSSAARFPGRASCWFAGVGPA